MDKLIEVQVGIRPEETTFISAELDLQEQRTLLALLRKNHTNFAWNAQQMPGVDPEVACHKLAVDPSAKPIKQRLRKMNPRITPQIEEEVQKLLDAGFIRPSLYPKWVSNIVAVPKRNGMIRICIDFTNLNKACPMHPYPLPRVSELVDATAGHERLSFLDAFSGYNQIPLYKPDQEHTTFITSRGLYCYTVMPFGLKNAGASFQLFMNTVLAPHLGTKVEVYIDDMVVKTVKQANHFDDLQAIFNRLSMFKVKLNPMKCAFGVSEGKFLGYVITRKGIEANTDQIKAIQDMPSPTNKKEIQKLTGRLAAISRFISRFSDKCQPFFKVLREAKIEWTPDCEYAFKQIKRYLQEPPILTSPKPDEVIGVYLAASESAVSSVLFVDGRETPIYFLSKKLNEAEMNYPTIQKITLALVHSARRVGHYFQGRFVKVYTEYPIQKILQNGQQCNRLAEWSSFLSSFNFSFESRKSEKGHTIASLMCDFPVENVEEPAHMEEAFALATFHQTSATEPKWTLYTDGSHNKSGAGVGCLIIDPAGLKTEKAVTLGFKASNNEAEYEAAIYALRLAKNMGALNVNLYTDSKLLANQYGGTYVARNDRMSAYLNLVHQLAKDFHTINITQKPRHDIRHADSLAYLAAAMEDKSSRKIMIEFQEKPSIQLNETTTLQTYVAGCIFFQNCQPTLPRVNQVQTRKRQRELDEFTKAEAATPLDHWHHNDDIEPPLPDDFQDEDAFGDMQNIDLDIVRGDTSPDDWQEPFIQFIIHKTQNPDPVIAKKVQKQAWQFEVIPDSTNTPHLYKKSDAHSPLRRCLTKKQGIAILEQIHSGECGNHFAGRSLAHKALTQGYWWPYMRDHAKAVSKRCESCQKHEHMTHLPATYLSPMMCPWPFAQWGLDIVGPFPKAKGGKRFLIVATDYSTKWVEAKALVHITSQDVRRFIWEDIICRFGIPHTIISDNGKQFSGQEVNALCLAYNIKHNFSAPYHPQANGQAEATNKTLLDILKKRLVSTGKKWTDQLPPVLWAYRTTPKHSTGLSPFHLAFGAEAVLPTEIMLPTSRTASVEQGLNDQLLSNDRALLDETRLQAIEHILKYQEAIKKRYDKKVKQRSFQQGDWVLRRAVRMSEQTKLDSNWKGPYIIDEVAPKGAYFLRTVDGERLALPWNAIHLKMFYR